MGKRVAALIGIVLLVGMYILTLVISILNKESSGKMVFASMGLSIIVPVFVYIYCKIYDVVIKKKTFGDDDLIRFDNREKVDISNTEEEKEDSCNN